MNDAITIEQMAIFSEEEQRILRLYLDPMSWVTLMDLRYTLNSPTINLRPPKGSGISRVAIYVPNLAKEQIAPLYRCAAQVTIDASTFLNQIKDIEDRDTKKAAIKFLNSAKSVAMALLSCTPDGDAPQYESSESAINDEADNLFTEIAIQLIGDLDGESPKQEITDAIIGERVKLFPDICKLLAVSEPPVEQMEEIDAKSYTHYLYTNPPNPIEWGEVSVDRLIEAWAKALHAISRAQAYSEEKHSGPSYKAYKGIQDALGSLYATGLKLNFLLKDESLGQLCYQTMIARNQWSTAVNAALPSVLTGRKGKAKQVANAKRKKAVKDMIKAERNAPRTQALDTFRMKHPNCTITEAAKALSDRKTVQTEDAAKKWLQRLVKEGGIKPFNPGTRGRPLGGGGVCKPR